MKQDTTQTTDHIGDANKMVPQTTFDSWNEAYKNRPIDPLCECVIEICIVGKRCIYINDHRVQGGKPYMSESLPSETRKTTVRKVLDAFSTEEINAYLREKVAADAYCAGLRNYRDAAKDKSDAA